jgi:hypothetical protein
MYTLILFFIILIGLTLLYEPPKEYFQTQNEKYLELAKNKTKLEIRPSDDQIKNTYTFTQEYKTIINDKGDKQKIPYHKTQGELLYFIPGSKKYHYWNMNYEDSIRFARI